MSNENKISDEVKKLSFEESLKELEKIVNELDSGSIDLDMAVEAYEKGTELKQHCEKKLKEAKLRIEKIEVTKDSDFVNTEIDSK